MTGLRTVEWKDGAVVMIDQRKLPHKEEYLKLTDYRQVAEAVRNLSVRGAPAIGVTVALGIALGMKDFEGNDRAAFDARFEDVCRCMAGTRPTAVNTFWAIDRMREVADGMKGRQPREVRDGLIRRAREILEEEEGINRAMGRYGQEVVPADATVLTHCNAGALACTAYGTALGVVRAAVEAGKRVRVLADETRPVLQGARLTAWELAKDGIPVTLITDSMAGYVMKSGMVDLVVVGADRVARNGDVANKIGTYGVAVLAREHRIPFYVAAPLSTYDAAIPDGSHITIEQRDPSEVTTIGGHRICPEGIDVLNPAFDVTPARLVSGIMTEKGIVRPPYEDGFRKIMKGG